MKRLLAVTASSVLIFAGCTSKLEFGESYPTVQDSPEVSAGAEEELDEESFHQTSEPEHERPSPQGFEEILRNSCVEALEVGVEETSQPLGVSYILFPEELSIDGYSAIEHNQINDEVSLVWETDVFYTCYFSNRLDMAEEFGASVPISFENVLGGFKIVDQSFDETYSFEVKVVNGLIDEFDDGDAVWSVIYGVGEDKLALLELAIQEFED